MIKKLSNLYEGIGNWFKNIENEILKEDQRTNGRFSSALIATFCFLALVCFAFAFLVFGGN